MQCRTLLPWLTLIGGFLCGVIITMLFSVQGDSVQKIQVSSPGQFNTHARFSNTPKRFDLANLESRKYLFPEYVPRRRAVPLEHPSHLRLEYKLRKTLFVGVLSSQKYLATRAKAVYETWASEVSMLVFFVGEDCDVLESLAHLPIIKLKGISDGIYPPLKKAFAVMQYMYDHFSNDYNWFIRADDDAYMRGQKLMDLLHSLDETEVISLGRAGEGRNDELGRLQLLKHERYCMGGPGMIFSRGAMLAIGPYLDLCLNAILYHDRKHPDYPWHDDDVEIGRCLSRQLDVQCSTSHEAFTYFYFDYIGEGLDPATLWTKYDFREMISIHPIKDPDHIHSFHLFYKTLAYEDVFLEQQKLSRSLSSLCKNLPSRLVPPSFLSTNCSIEFGSSHQYSKNSPPQKRQVHHHHKDSRH